MPINTPIPNNYYKNENASTDSNNVFYRGRPISKLRIFLVMLLVGFLLVSCCGSCILVSIMTESNSLAIMDSPFDIKETKISTIGENKSQNKKIAIINITDVISYVISGTNPPSGTNNATIVAQLDKALNDDSIKAVLLRINSPGGAADAADPICKSLQNLQKSKKVYSFIETEGASLGYLIPNCTELIYSKPGAIVGSIGVRVDLIDFNGVIEKIGGKVQTVTNTAGVEKTQDGLFNQDSPAYKRLQSILDETYNYFLETVEKGRTRNTKLNKEKLKSIADGQIFSGRQAYEIGLVDELGDFEDALYKLYQEVSYGSEKIDIIEYSIIENPFTSIFGAVNASVDFATGKISVKRNEARFMMIYEY